jgi:hypothetical protein
MRQYLEPNWQGSSLFSSVPPRAEHAMSKVA